MDYFYQPLPPIQCWRRRKHRSMQWPNFRTSDHVGINFQNSRNFPTLEKSPWSLQHWIGGKGLENKRSSREKHTFRPSALKNKKTRMRARDFGTPLVLSSIDIDLLVLSILIFFSCWMIFFHVGWRKNEVPQADSAFCHGVMGTSVSRYESDERKM